MSVASPCAAAPRARRRPDRTDRRVVVVGAGLAGLSRRPAAGRRGPPGHGPGARGRPRRARRADRDAGYRFDTGPTVLTMPDLIADAFDAVGEEMSDWLDLVPVDPLLPRLLPRRLAARRARRRRSRWPTRSRASSARTRPPATGATSTSSRELYRYEMARLHRPQHRLPARPAHPGPGPAGGAGRVPPARAEGAPVPQGPAHRAGLLVPGDVRRALARTTRSRSTR